MTTVTVHSDFGAQENKICHCFHFSPSIFHKVMELDAKIIIFLILSFKQLFHFPVSPLSRGSLVPLQFLPFECIICISEAVDMSLCYPYFGLREASEKLVI